MILGCRLVLSLHFSNEPVTSHVSSKFKNTINIVVAAAAAVVAVEILEEKRNSYMWLYCIKTMLF